MSLDLLRDPISASRETIQFRFKTSHANGVLLYSKGTQGDFFALQLYENRMILNLNLGESLSFVPWISISVHIKCTLVLKFLTIIYFLKNS